MLLNNNKKNPRDPTQESEISRSWPDPLKQAYQLPKEKTEKAEFDIDPTSQTPRVRDLVNRIKTPWIAFH